ncbi:MAG: glycosyltransferase family 39 protein, partial [Verrucomicrobiales bacterium]|nr:glycosyltransferase family 39 protein [Verrucomicrobiales bacterium]
MQTYVPPDRLIPKTVSAVALFLVALGLLGTFLFLPSLENRPLHTDEAILADKLGTLIDDGTWKYDTTDFHGPALPYSALLTSELSGKNSYTSLTKTSIRLVPAIYAILLLFLLPLVSDGLGRVSIGFAALLTAVSPMFLYYSRYFIMEVPFVVFTFALIAFGWRYFMTRRARWALAAGVAAGLVHATKETCIITFFALGAALFATGAIDYFVRGSGLGVINRKRKEPFHTRHIVYACILAAIVSATLFSSFFTNLSGIFDSFTTYASYLDRSKGSGHEKPWYYYIILLTWKPSGGLVWSSAAILVLAMVGSGYAFLAAPDRNKNLHLPRFLTIYA